MGARKLSKQGQAMEQSSQGVRSAGVPTTSQSEQQAYDRESQTRNDMARQGEQERARFTQAANDMERQGAQERARFMQDRASQTANDMARQGAQGRTRFMQDRASAQPSMHSTPTGRRRFSWQR